MNDELPDDFPEIGPEPTSFYPHIAEETECHYCDETGYELEVPGGVIHFACRNCKIGSRYLQSESNYGSGWKEIREWVLSRDNYRCVECGNGDDLHVHHIEKLVWFETTQEANRPGNLATLCESCHRELEGNPDHFQTI